MGALKYTVDPRPRYGSCADAVAAAAASTGDCAGADPGACDGNGYGSDDGADEILY